jgi:hypothetical protein
MAGDKLNPALVKAFVSVVTFFPVGSIVRTTRDEVGIVVRTHEDDALHPGIVLVDPDAAGGPPGPYCDMRERGDRGDFVRDVVETVPEGQCDLDVAAVLRHVEQADLAT